MRIRSATASFGKLENETLRFHDGLNVIHAPNESGKSTWCAFVRAMLYGIDTSERARRGFLPDKQKYAPWSGAPMEGQMDVTADGCEITIIRSTRLPNAPMQEFKAVYTGTADEVEGLTGSNAGEMLTGVSREVFRRSAFIGQGAVAVTGGPELEKRINAIVSTGEEETSFSEADERLKAWLRKRRNNRNGELPEIEAKLDEANRELEEAREGARQIGELEEALKGYERECGRLEQEAVEARKQQRKKALEKLEQGDRALEAKRKNYEALAAEYSDKREALRSSRFGMISAEEAEKKTAEDLERYEEIAARSAAKGGSPLPFLLCLVAAAALAAVYAVNHMLILIIAAGAACLAGIWAALRYISRRNRSREDEEEKRQILRKYSASAPEDIRKLAEEHALLVSELKETEGRLRSAGEEYNGSRQAQAEIRQRAIDALDFSAEGVGETSAITELLRAAREKRAAAERELARLRGRLDHIGDSVVLESNIAYLEDRYETVNREYDTIELAGKVLREADQEIQNRFAPRLGELAAEYMSVLTGGKYDSVMISKDFSAMARESGGSVARRSEYLSAGTLDLLYLAVRLAVCELALPEGESCPLIIDDALVNLDEERTAKAMELLGEISRSRQVILFTCRE